MARRSVKISSKDPGALTASQINAELDKLDAASSANGAEMIAAGRGYEKFTESIELAKAGDPLAVERLSIADRHLSLQNEVSTRYGPGAPSRLPTHQRGYFGPRKRG
jgi:hypothetical protein